MQPASIGIDTCLDLYAVLSSCVALCRSFCRSLSYLFGLKKADKPVCVRNEIHVSLGYNELTTCSLYVVNQ